MQRFRRNKPFLHAILRKAKTKERQDLLQHANADQINAISELVLNLLKQNIPMSKSLIGPLRPYRQPLRNVAKMHMVPEEDVRLISWYKNNLTDNPILHATAQLGAQQHSLLREPDIPPAVKKSMIQQIEPPYHKYTACLRKGDIGEEHDDILPSTQQQQDQDDDEPEKAIKTPPAPSRPTKKRKTSLAKQRLQPALGWEDWEPSGKRPRRSVTTAAKPKGGGGGRGKKATTRARIECDWNFIKIEPTRIALAWLSIFGSFYQIRKTFKVRGSRHQSFGQDRQTT